jgi:nondiscriminating aspartyl-tRNA synthetase
MQRVWSIELPSHVGQPVRLAGWLHHRRVLGQITFVLVRDGRGIFQVVVKEPATRAELDEMLPETVLEVRGQVVAEAQAPGGVEIHLPEFRVIASPVDRSPIELRRPHLKEPLPFILDHAPLALRHPRQRAIFEVSGASVFGFRDRLSRLGFVEIQTPKIVVSATETGANLFRVDYFGRPAYLAQSPQFYKQIMVGVFERVFETGPVFRAEPHDTARHLTEYVSLDAEIGFIDDHTTVMATAREAVAGMVESVRSSAERSLSLLGASLPQVPEAIPSVHFREVQEMIDRDSGAEEPPELDLSPSNERWLGEWAAREFGSDFLFVTGFPMEKRPFYTHPDSDDARYSRGFDLLFRGVEIITGGQRLHRYEDYVEALGKLGESPSDYEGYLQAFRFGMPPHGGFAIGLERWVAQLLGLRNVRLATLFPRDPSRLTP